MNTTTSARTACPHCGTAHATPQTPAERLAGLLACLTAAARGR